MALASGAEVVAWLGAIAERLRSTPAATLNTDDITESTTRRHTKTNPSNCGRVSLAIIFKEISLRRPNPVALTTWPEPSCSRIKKDVRRSERAQHRLKLAQKKHLEFLDDNNRNNQNYVEDLIREAEVELNWARHKLAKGG